MQDTLPGCFGPGASPTGSSWLARIHLRAMQLFTAISEILLCLFYLHKKSPAIGEDLKEVFHVPKEGNAPIRCQGTRWINHKRRAMQQVVD